MQQHPLIPARMLNEHVYCPRLAWLEWVQGEWAPSADTVQGSHIHKRVDKPGGALPCVDGAQVLTPVKKRGYLPLRISKFDGGAMATVNRLAF